MPPSLSLRLSLQQRYRLVNTDAQTQHITPVTGFVVVTAWDVNNYLSITLKLNTMTQTIDFTKVNHDVNGNPRYVCHFLALINDGDRIKADTKGMGSISEEYNIALNKAKAIGGRKFHNKQYGGGIVFQSYNIKDEETAILAAKQVNTIFLKEWTPKQFKQVERAIYRHLVTYTYKWLEQHGQPLKDFHPLSYEQINNVLGLAYTSTGDYAGLWVCNSGYLMANETHHFSGFAINTDGKVIGIVEDESENQIFIEL